MEIVTGNLIVTIIDANKPSQTLKQYQATHGVVPQISDEIELNPPDSPIINMYRVVRRIISFKDDKQLVDVFVVQSQ